MHKIKAMGDSVVAGNILYDIMEESITNGDGLHIDMTNVDCLTSVFLNVSLGKYLEKHGKASITGKLSFSNISSSQVGRLRDYMSRF